MNDLPRQKLRELLIEYGRSLCDDPRRCEALLKDYYPEKTPGSAGETVAV